MMLFGILLAFRRPEHSALHQYPRFGRLVEDVVVMTEGRVEHPAVAPELRPRDRHIHRLVGNVIIIHEREPRRREHLYRRVNV